MKRNMKFLPQRGFSLLEVVIAIAIFAIGMLALASMQGSLTRSSADGNLRTVATNIAERTIEDLRGFGRIDLDLNPDLTLRIPAYAGIVDKPSEEVWAAENSVVGLSFIRTIEVTDYYYVIANDNFSTTAPTGEVVSDFKLVEVNVSWGGALEDNAGFQLDESQDSLSSAELGSGDITLSTMISSITSQGSARVSTQGGGDAFDPFVNYTPGQKPNIVALSLGGNKYKESLTPEPEVVRRDDVAKTTFEVVTFSQDGTSEFLRREEFVTVPCECEFAGTGSSRRPVIWAGDEYAGGHFVNNKPYGVSTNNQQPSVLCNTCCRDHHDGGSSPEDSSDEYSNVFGPFKANDEYSSSGQARRSDHDHYLDADGPLVTSGSYLEVCRFVRVDGFFRVAQDFRREDQYDFPADFLDAEDLGGTEIMAYSDYITGAVAAYTGDVGVRIDYPTDPPCIGIPQPPIDGDPTCVAIPNMQYPYPEPRASNQLPSWTSLQTGVIDEQQLRSRGIYIDYLSYDLRKFLDSCISGGALVDDCCIRGGVVANQCTADDLYMDKTGSANVLEILPFFEVQMTKLENWDQSSDEDPLIIALTNDPIADANSHRRGEASQWIPEEKGSIVLGTTWVEANSHRGNIGFTNTLAIDPKFTSQLKHAKLDLQSLDATGGGSSGSGRPVVRLIGSFSAETVIGDPTISVLGDGDAYCGLTPGGYWCNYPVERVSPPTLIVDGYEDVTPDGDGAFETRYVCSDTLIRTDSSTAIGNTYAVFSLLDSSGENLPDGTTYDIRIQLTDCGGGLGT